MKLKDLQPKFNGFTVIAVDGERVALLSDKGVPHLSTAKKDGDDYIIGTKDEVKANAVFGEGESSMEIPVEAIADILLSRCNQLEKDLSSEKEAREAVEKTLCNMQRSENTRRKKVVKETIKSRLNEIRENNDGCDISENACDGLMTDEKISAYAEMETEDGEFCGDSAAKKDVDSICMNAIVSAGRAKMNAKKSRFAWEAPFGESGEGEDGVGKAIADILK